ncbi:Clr6 histone deacetylase associated PHD protein-2 Cph2, partial [Teratosphaeriaceae sp. CCFEE 6253]
MDSNARWAGGFGHTAPGYGQQFENGQTGEDWEDWLRWDPAAEATSPDDGTFNSGSSKNDSPVQDPVLPVAASTYGKDETLAPPLIFGEDALDFSAVAVPDGEPFLFGASQDAGAGFEFASQVYQPMQPNVPMRIETKWALPSTIVPEDVILPALSADNIPLGYNFAATSIPPSLDHSPDSSSQQRSSLSGKSGSNSPPEQAPPKKRGGRKRKVEIEQEQLAEQFESQDGDEPPMKKTSHNVIEKRYRNNLNDKIVELRNAVPALRAMGRANHGADEEDLEGLTPAHKLNKATVMGKATEYIRHLEKRNKTMGDEMASLQERLAAVEAAIGKNRDRQASMSRSPPTPSGTTKPRQPSGASPSGTHGYLNVPQQQAAYGQPVVQQQYAQPQQQPAYAPQPGAPVEAQSQPQYVYTRGRGGVMSKVMMGAMAGIMVMEGVSEQQQVGDARQLFAVPSPFKRGLMESGASASPTTLARHAILPLVKMCLVVGALVYLIAPLLTFSPRRKQKVRHTVRLPQVPSLASPVEVRRKAWLTAMQTVYVPKHFLLEVAAVTAKMISLSLRRLVGSETWNAITGTNKEEEAARFKAWDIAVDAQLAGGDAQVSYYRLLLTLMASGTLPDSPTRLMQKAVHFRVFFWEL